MSKDDPDCPVKISELRAMAKAKDLQAVVLLSVARNGAVGVVTYGETKQKCKEIGKWGQGLWKYAISRIPFQTVFGWGNNGKPMTKEEVEQLILHGMDMGDYQR